METLILLTVLTVVFSILYIRILKKDYQELRDKCLRLKMDNIEMGDDIRKYKQIEKKYNSLTELTLTQIDVLNEKVSGSKKTETEPDSKIYRKESGIFEKWELVTSHIGRRSFATNFYGTGIPTNLLMTATGHSTEKMFLNYIGKGNKDYAKELNNYFNIK